MLVEPQTAPGSAEPCRKATLPDRNLSQREVFDYWAQDRATIETCDQRRAAGSAP